jgi:hypothetical protein
VVEEQPAYFILGNEEDLKTDPGPLFRLQEGSTLRRDPYFPLA